MSIPILIIDANSEFYRSKLAPQFPAAEFRAAPNRGAVTEKQLADAEAIVGLGVRMVFDEDLLGAAKRLKWIQALTTGSDGITCLRSLRPEVVITTNTGIHGPQMSEMAIMYMLNLARQAPRLWENQKRRRWERWTFTRLAGKTLVIVGTGSIAQSLAPRCKALDMKVLGVSGTPREVTGFDRIYPRSRLVEVAAQADFMVLLAPLTPENEKLIDARVLAAMKPSAFLINLARGEVCDEEALIEALRSKRLAGAGLDVFTTIPLPPENPLWGMENVLISPQLAGSSEVNQLLNLPILETNTRCFLEGRWSDMINRVSR